MSRRRVKSNHLPAPDDYDYEELFNGIKLCRELVIKYRAACGSQVPVRHEADILLDHLEAFALLTPVANAIERIKPNDHIIKES